MKIITYDSIFNFDILEVKHQEDKEKGIFGLELIPRVHRDTNAVVLNNGWFMGLGNNKEKYNMEAIKESYYEPYSSVVEKGFRHLFLETVKNHIFTTLANEGFYDINRNVKFWKSSKEKYLVKEKSMKYNVESPETSLKDIKDAVEMLESKIKEGKKDLQFKVEWKSGKNPYCDINWEE